MDSNPIAAQKKRSSMLDCIRAVAVTMVVLYHIGVETPEAPDPIAAWFFRHGLLGVDIFFPLSGFLITSYLLENNGRRDIGTFFLRRFFRIVPLYMLALLVYAVACLATQTNLDTLQNIWKNALFLTGWTIFHEGRSTVPYTITWSLSVEEFAYIALGLSALVFRGRMAGLLIAMTIGALILRYMINIWGYPDVYFYPPARLDSIAVGGLAAWAVHKRIDILLPMCLLLAVTWGLMQTGHIPFHTLIYFLITVMTSILILVIVTRAPKVENVIISAIASIGFYSYFIYLFHYFFIIGLDVLLDMLHLWMSVWVRSTIVLAATYAAAMLSYRLYEGPLMAFGRRLETRTGSGSPPTALTAKVEK